MISTSIPVENVEQAWPALEPHIERVCRLADWSAATVKKRLLAAEAQAWAVLEEGRVQAAVITEILDRDRDRCCNIWLCAGSYSDQARDSLLREVEDWARRIGCERVTLIGRRGWEKKLPAYRRTRVILEKKL